MCVFFTLTDRASAIPIHIRGCQSGAWSAGQEKVRGTSTKLQREHKTKTRNKAKDDKKKEKKKQNKNNQKQQPKANASKDG